MKRIIQVDCIEHIKYMKAPKPFYNINHEKNLLQHSVKEIYDQFGGPRNYQDDRYTSNFDSLSRDRRDLSYGNPCHPPRAACAALHSYTGRSATGRNFIKNMIMTLFL